VARYHPRTGSGDVVLDCRPDLTVQADPDDLVRAVSNLLENALRHGRVPITLTARPRPAAGTGDGDGDGDGDGEMVDIEVRDHGAGFDPGFLPHATERFSRADPGRTGGGAGLGLAITAALARRNGGRLTAANHPGGGALLTLPTPPHHPPHRRPGALPAPGLGEVQGAP